MEITGKLIVQGDVVHVSDKFKKRTFVIETDDKYPQTIQFEAQQERVNTLENAKVGEWVEVKFNLRGRKWTNKEGVDMYFNTLVAWQGGIVSAPKQEAEEVNDLPFD